MLSEEAKVIKMENDTEIITAYNRIPYALINAELGGTTKDTLDELTEICKYYRIYIRTVQNLTLRELMEIMYQQI